jgi:hypothetical protein
LNLENEYLACTVFVRPRGHLYGCRAKLSGAQMFYANSSSKKSLIGLRGAWIATGIEQNFRLCTACLTVSPVDFGIVQHTDAAAVWVLATDRLTGMRWAVRYVLEGATGALRGRTSGKTIL